MVTQYAGGNIRVVPEIWIATIDNTMVEDVTALLIDGSVDMNVDRDVALACQITLQDVDRLAPYTDYLAPRLRISYEDGRAEVLAQLGLYAIRVPPGAYTVARAEATVTGDDLTSVLQDASLTDTWNIAAGTNVRAAIIALIEDGGITRHRIPASTVTLTAATSFFPGTTNLDAINRLCEMLGWYHVSTDLEGWITTPGPTRDLSQLAPFATYTEDDIRSPSFIVNPSDLQVVNVVTVVNDNNADAPMFAVARNDNPDSPTSTVNLGERSYPGGPIQVSGETTQAALDKIAQQYLAAGRSYYRTGQFAVLPEPAGLIPHQSVDLTLAGKMAPLSGRWWVRTARLGIRPQSASLTLEVNQVTDFTGSPI